MALIACLFGAFLAVAPTTAEASQLDDDSLWYVLKGGTDASPEILSVRPELPDATVRAAFPIEVTMRWKYDANETGLPAYEEDLHDMYRFEGELRSRDPDERIFLQAIRRTGAGVRTWIFFTPSAKAFRDFVGATSKVTFEFARDPDWSQLAEILADIER